MWMRGEARFSWRNEDKPGQRRTRTKETNTTQRNKYNKLVCYMFIQSLILSWVDVIVNANDTIDLVSLFTVNGRACLARSSTQPRSAAAGIPRRDARRPRTFSCAFPTTPCLSCATVGSTRRGGRPRVTHWRWLWKRSGIGVGQNGPSRELHHLLLIYCLTLHCRASGIELVRPAPTRQGICSEKTLEWGRK